MFMCLQIEDFKRKRTGGRLPWVGKCVIRYTVKLNDAGRPVWVRHAGPLWWVAGYIDCETRAKKRVKKRCPDFADLPYIQSAHHGKLVSKTEAQKLLGSHWLPHAALDYITDELQNQPVASVEPEEADAT